MEKERWEVSLRRFIENLCFFLCLFEMFGGCLTVDHDFVILSLFCGFMAKKVKKRGISLIPTLY